MFGYYAVTYIKHNCNIKFPIIIYTPPTRTTSYIINLMLFFSTQLYDIHKQVIF